MHSASGAIILENLLEMRIREGIYGVGEQFVNDVKDVFMKYDNNNCVLYTIGPCVSESYEKK